MKRKVGGRILVDAKLAEKRAAETLRQAENKNAFLPGVYIKHFFPSAVGFKCISRKKKKTPVKKQTNHLCVESHSRRAIAHRVCYLL